MLMIYACYRFMCYQQYISMLHVIRQSINYHVLEDYTMASISNACSTRTYLHCIMRLRPTYHRIVTNNTAASSSWSISQSLYIQCMHLVYACLRFILYSVHIGCMLRMLLLLLSVEKEEHFCYNPYQRLSCYRWLHIGLSCSACPRRYMPCLIDVACYTSIIEHKTWCNTWCTIDWWGTPHMLSIYNASYKHIRYCNTIWHCIEKVTINYRLLLYVTRVINQWFIHCIRLIMCNVVHL